MGDLNSIFIPKRISAMLRRIYTDRVTVICAPDGTGKSTLLREFTARTRPKGTAIRYITSAESTGSCFSQICTNIAGKVFSEPVSDSESSLLRDNCSALPTDRNLVLIVDCYYAAETLLGNPRTARLISECSCARFVFVCSSLKANYRRLADQLGFTVIDRDMISMTPEEVAEYAKRCSVRVNIKEVYNACRGAFLGTRLCFMLAQKGQEYATLTPVGRMIHAVLEDKPVRTLGAITLASAFDNVSPEYCRDMCSFNPIKDFFGSDLIDPAAIFEELVKFRREIPLMELNLRRRSVVFHPLFRQAIYRVFMTFPENVRHDLRICFGREYRRRRQDYFAFCEFFLAGEYELSSQIYNNERISYSMLIKSKGLLRSFITNCPLTCKPAIPRLLRICAMLMHTDLKPFIRDRMNEIMRHISRSADYSVSERRELLSYAYALKVSENMFELDKMGDSIKRAYDLFNGRRKFESPLFAWTMYSPTVFFLIHHRGHSIHTETAQFTRYQHMYTEMLDHGRYTEIIFAGEAKYVQGDLTGAHELLSAAASLCTGTGRIATRLTAIYCAAKCCLFLGDHLKFFEYLQTMLRIVRIYSSREEGDCARLMIGLLRAMRGGEYDDVWYTIYAESSDPLMNRFTLPYFETVKSVYLINTGNYSILAEKAPEYIKAASAAGNEAAEIKLQLLAAKALSCLGNWDTALQYVREALEAAQEDGLTSVMAEFYVICPDLLGQVRPLLTAELQQFTDLITEQGKIFLRGVETVRSFEITGMPIPGESGRIRDLVPLKRLMDSTDDLRRKLGLSEKAYSYAIMAVSGVTNREMSDIFGVSCDSIKSSLKRTYNTLGVKNRRGLIGIIPSLR